MSTADLRAALSRAQRFFARLNSFDLECPHCGTVHQISARIRRGSQFYDPMTARFKCRDCEHNYVLGILAWPIGKGAGVAGATPEDQVLNPRQLAQMRKEGGGWWMGEDQAQRFKRPHTTNLTTEEDRPDGEDEDQDE